MEVPGIEQEARKQKSATGGGLIGRNCNIKPMTTHTYKSLELSGGILEKIGGRTNVGEGIVVGIVDSGIDPCHPSFTSSQENPFIGNIFPFQRQYMDDLILPDFSKDENAKIVVAKYYIDEELALKNPDMDDKISFDFEGHGSHVASNVTGSDVKVHLNGCDYGSACGVAPHARIVVYNDHFIAAMNSAIEDGVHVLVLCTIPGTNSKVILQYDMIMLRAHRYGVVVVLAVGNHGPKSSSFYPSLSPPGACLLVLAPQVGGIQDVLCLEMGSRYLVQDYQDPVLYQHNGTNLYQPTKRAKNHVQIEELEEGQESCVFYPTIVAVALVICKFSKKYENDHSTLEALCKTAKLLKFGGFILTADYDFFPPKMSFDVPGIIIHRAIHAWALLNYYKQNRLGDAQAFIIEGRDPLFDHKPHVCDFSSRGPNVLKHENILKSDFVAPGYQIWGAHPSGFACCSGTSCHLTWRGLQHL